MLIFTRTNIRKVEINNIRFDIQIIFAAYARLCLMKRQYRKNRGKMRQVDVRIDFNIPVFLCHICKFSKMFYTSDRSLGLARIKDNRFFRSIDRIICDIKNGVAELNRILKIFLMVYSPEFLNNTAFSYKTMKRF